MDQLGRAVAALKAAQDDIGKAEATGRRLVTEARAAERKARTALFATIVKEYQAGARVSELARRTDYSRETIRRVLRNAGIEADR